MPIDKANIDAIIFDLGAVILNLDFDAPVREFTQLGINNFESLYSKAKQSTLFTDLEIGIISPQAFRDAIRQLLKAELPDNAIDKAWNAILLDFPASRIKLLEDLKKNYSTFLLSNTNSIHYDAYNDKLHAEYGYNELSEIMEKTYYSHQLGIRKPDVAIFKHVIEDAGLTPEKTLFIDDIEENVLAAKQVGLLGHHLKEHETIEKLLKPLI